MSQNPPQDDKPRVPLGEPMEDDEFFALAEMDEDAIQDAQDWWNEKASPTGKRLMDAASERNP